MPCLASLAMLTTACGHTSQSPSAAPVDRNNARAYGRARFDPAGALPDAGPTAACVRYSPRNVSRADIAFDGTVTTIGEGRADPRNAVVQLVPTTFKVHRWFKGGHGDTVTIDIPVAYSEDPQPPPFRISTRLLVSGTRPHDAEPQQPVVAWGCGYTRYYDPATASTWRAAMG